MERLTNKKEADAQRKAYKRRLEQGYPRNIPEERFLKLAEYEDAEEDGRLVSLPCKMGCSVYTIKEEFFNCDECEHKAESHYNPKIMRRSCDMDNHAHCPLKIVEHTVGGFEVSSGLHRKPKVSGPGEWGYEGLKEFCGYDCKWYLTYEEAEAALRGVADGT